MRGTKGWESLIRKGCILIFTGAYIIPLYIAFINAFKSYKDIILNPLALPINFTLDNFKAAYEKSNISALYLNSTIITVSSVSLLLLLASMLAYVTARSRGKVWRFINVFLLFGVMVPQQVIMIPSMKTLSSLNLLHKLPGLILFYIGTYLGLAYFLFYGFIKTVPISLEESARIDGASPLTVFFKIVFPLLKPITGTATIFLGMWIWNDFLPPLYILGTDKGSTITTGIYKAIGQYTTEWNIVFASVILVSLPIILLYLLMQTQFREGLAAGAVKG